MGEGRKPPEIKAIVPSKATTATFLLLNILFSSSGFLFAYFGSFVLLSLLWIAMIWIYPKMKSLFYQDLILLIFSLLTGPLKVSSGS